MFVLIDMNLVGKIKTYETTNILVSMKKTAKQTISTEVVEKPLCHKPIFCPTFPQLSGPKKKQQTTSHPGHHRRVVDGQKFIPQRHAVQGADALFGEGLERRRLQPGGVQRFKFGER